MNCQNQLTLLPIILSIFRSRAKSCLYKRENGRVPNWRSLEGNRINGFRKKYGSQQLPFDLVGLTNIGKRCFCFMFYANCGKIAL